MALGVTMQLPMDDKHNYSRDYLKDQIAILLGGRIAEEITNGKLTTGAGNDLERVTDLARKMVCEWGMSDAMGPLTFGKREEQIFLGREISKTQDYSEETARRIDQEVKRIVMDNYERARTVLEQHKPALLKIADELLAREVLDADQVMRLAKGLDLEELVPPAPASVPPSGEPRREALRASGDRAVARTSRSDRNSAPASSKFEAQTFELDYPRVRRLHRSSPRRPRRSTLGARTLVMGIVNVTPDSFADGGVRFDPGRRDCRRRADGGGRRRPDRHRRRVHAAGAPPLDDDEEWRRVEPVIEGCARRVACPISIDTYKATSPSARSTSARPSSTTSAR